MGKGNDSLGESVIKPNEFPRPRRYPHCLPTGYNGGSVRAHSSMAEHAAHNRLVAGSSPAGPTLSGHLDDAKTSDSLAHIRGLT